MVAMALVGVVLLQRSEGGALGIGGGGGGFMTGRSAGNALTKTTAILAAASSPPAWRCRSWQAIIGPAPTILPAGEGGGAAWRRCRSRATGSGQPVGSCRPGSAASPAVAITRARDVR